MLSDVLRRPLLADRIDWDEDATGSWLTEVHHGVDRRQERFGDLVSVAEVDRLLMTGLLRGPFVRMFRDERELPFTDFGGHETLAGEEVVGAVDPRRIATLVRTGATVSLTGAHRWHVPVGQLCLELSDTLGHPVQANIYLTPPRRKGLRLHYDTHDVVVLQVAGMKTWEVYEPVIEAPLPTQPWSARPEAADPGWVPPTPARLRRDLRRGDALFVPRGWLHRASTDGELSLHVTIGILARTWWHVIEDMVRAAGRSPAVRATVDFSVPSAEIVDAVVDVVSSLSDDFWREAARQGVIAQSIRNERYAPHFAGALTAALESGLLDDGSYLGRGTGTVRVVDRGGQPMLVGPAGCVVLDPVEMAAWQFVAGRDEWPVSSLAEAGLDPPARVSFVDRLLEAGIVVSRPRPPDGSR
ncbi:MAG: cupin domain-containing protein [Actinomycetota bacterium]|jgi:bifunctional lysine-specific demethylase and histidyl-hydroxylase NO66